jgi:hypothetical protein
MELILLILKKYVTEEMYKPWLSNKISFDKILEKKQYRI